MVGILGDHVGGGNRVQPFFLISLEGRGRGGVAGACHSCLGGVPGAMYVLRGQGHRNLIS